MQRSLSITRRRVGRLVILGVLGVVMSGCSLYAAGSGKDNASGNFLQASVTCNTSKHTCTGGVSGTASNKRVEGKVTTYVASTLGSCSQKLCRGGTVTVKGTATWGATPGVDFQFFGSDGHDNHPSTTDELQLTIGGGTYTVTCDRCFNLTDTLT